jgi:hypothetical protein
VIFHRNPFRTGRVGRISGCVLAALVWVSVPAAAGAQEAPGDVARARELFLQATDLRDQGDVRGALDKFKEAHALAVNPITTFELARAYAALGMLVEARDAYASIARLPVQPDETDRATQARHDGAQAADQLRSRIPTLTVKLAVPADTLSITLDGEPVAAAVLVAPRAVDPGTHHLVATGATGSRVEQTVTVKEGESREVALELAPAPADAREAKGGASSQAAPASVADASRQPPDGSGNHFGPFAYAGFGVGVTGFVVGTVLAAATLSKASSIQCGSAGCEQASIDAAHSTRDLGFAAAISYTVGGVGVAIGLADLVLYKRGPTTPTTGLALHPWIGAGSAGVNGSF